MTAQVIPLSNRSTPTKPMAPDPKLTDTQLRALKMLVEAGGGALMPKTGQVLCNGSVGEQFEGDGGIHSRTWMGLLAAGCIYGSSGRIYPTDLGRAVIGGKP